MQAIRQVYEDAPASIPVPEQCRRKRIKWPTDYFEQTFGSLPDFPERESQGVYEIREPLE